MDPQRSPWYNKNVNFNKWSTIDQVELSDQNLQV